MVEDRAKAVAGLKAKYPSRTPQYDVKTYFAYQVAEAIDEAVSISRASPIDMVLFCPACGVQHIDKAEVALAWTGGAVPEPSHDEVTWDNPPHRSHLCGACGCIWRPAGVATSGVKSVQTKGKADTFDPASCRYACANFPHCGCEVKALSPPGTPQASESDGDDGAWIIWFEDTEVAPELYSGYGARNAAAARFEQMKIGYNCHLFQQVTTPQADGPTDEFHLSCPSCGTEIDLKPAPRSATPQAPEDVREFKCNGCEDTGQIGDFDLKTGEPDYEPCPWCTPKLAVGAGAAAERALHELDEQLLLTKAQQIEVVNTLARAHPLATPVTVTMEECKQIADMLFGEGLHNSGADIAAFMSRVLGGRIQIAGEGPK